MSVAPLAAQHPRTDQGPPARTRLAVLAAVVGGLVAGAALTAVALALPPGLGPGVVALAPLALVAVGMALRDVRWAVGLFSAALPAGLTTLFGGVQLVQVAAAAAVGVVVVARLWRGRAPLVLNPAIIALLVFAAWTVATLLVAPELPRALRYEAVLVTAVLLAAAIATACGTSAERLQQIAGVLLAGSVTTCLLALPESAPRGSFGGGEVEGRAQGVFSQPNELGIFAGTTLVLAVALVVGASGRRQRLLAGAGALVALVCLAFSLSRGAWLGTVLALVVAVALVPAVRRLSVGVVLAVAVATVVMVGTESTPVQLQVVGARAAVITDRAANPNDARPAIWAEALRQVRAHPVTGVGPAAFPLAAAGSSDVIASVRPDHAHNALLTFAAESGLPAVGALLAAIGAIGAGVFRGWARPGWPVRRRAFLGVVGCVPLVVLGHGILDAPLRNATTLLQTAAVLGLAIAVARVRPGSTDTPREAS